MTYRIGVATITLPPDLESFASDAVADGRYRDPAEVVAAALRLSQRVERERDAFLRSREEAEAEADRDGWCCFDEVLAEADQTIAEKRNAA